MAKSVSFQGVEVPSVLLAALESFAGRDIDPLVLKGWAQQCGLALHELASYSPDALAFFVTRECTHPAKLGPTEDQCSS